MKTIKLFLSSPGDCNEERDAVHNLAEKLNADPLISSHTYIEVVAWDWGAGVALDALYSPQTSVNQHLPSPENCEIFIGIFRCRFGSPLPINEFSKDNGKPFLSGSEYEFVRAWQAKRLDYGLPHHIWLYRWADSSCPDKQQLTNLNSFFSSPPFKEDTTWTGSVNSFKTTDNFTSKLDGHLRLFLSQWSPNATQTIDSWCSDQASKITANAGPRYTANAHVTTDIGKVFDWLLKRDTAIETFDSALEKVWGEIKRKPEFNNHRTILKTVSDSLRADPHWKNNTPDFSKISHTLGDIQDLAWTLYDNIDSEKEDESDIDGIRYSFSQIATISNDAKNLIDTFSGLSEKRVLLLKGPAGQGKTHTLVHEIHNTLRSNGISIGILGQELTGSGELWTEIKQHLDFDGSTSKFLDNLENAAANRSQRALLVFDALNETNDRSRWKSQLLGIIDDILKRPHLSIAISIRSDYIDYVLPDIAEADTAPWIIWNHPGFSGVEPNALIKYFAHYGVKAPVAPPLGELSNPLYVQLLAKSMQGNEDFKHWLPSWLEVWSTWIDKLESEAKKKFDLDPSRPTPIRRSMHKLADYMLDNNLYVISRNQADDITKRTSGTDGIISFLCSTGALIDHIDEQHDDVIEFAYERLTDTFLVDRILNKIFLTLETPDDKKQALSAALSVKGELYPLASDQWVDHPFYFRRSGLLKALCLAAPLHINAEIPQLLDSKAHKHDWQLREAFTDSLRWRSKPNEFGANADDLYKLWELWGNRSDTASELDELIGFSLIPGHPLDIDQILHPWLLGHKTVGERDTDWTINLIPLLNSGESLTYLLLNWSNCANLNGIDSEVALPIAKILAWTTSTSQRGIREQSIKGLTRLFVACPSIIEQFLPDFLHINDPYILEASLIATLGLVGSNKSPEVSVNVAHLVYAEIFTNIENTLCHLSIRHYARRIIELASVQHKLDGIDLNKVAPPYKSTLPLDNVPNKKDLESLDDSPGFNSIVHSATQWDFYRYIMGGNSASLVFLSTPKPTSIEPPRPFTSSENRISARAKSSIFDLALAGRFVAWNCLNLGWTSKRFNEFDTGLYTRELSRQYDGGRIERIGKKYQWISWQTLLAFLSDNYEMKDDYNNVKRIYENPGQISYIDILDPSRWVSSVDKLSDSTSTSELWEIPSLPNWPEPNIQSMKHWVKTTINDFPASDLITYCPYQPNDWGDGPWLNVAAEHIWTHESAPGLWGINQKYYSDIWWQASPKLISKSDLPVLLQHLNDTTVVENLLGIGRIDIPQEYKSSLTEWPLLEGEFAEGLGGPSNNSFHDKFPVDWMPLIGACGDPDHRDEQGPILLPWPLLFRMWELELDLDRGIIHKDGEVIFGIPSWASGEDALAARIIPLKKLLDESDLELIWLTRGERRAFLDWGNMGSNKERAWADLYGISFLGPDLRVQTAWFDYKIKK